MIGKKYEVSDDMYTDMSYKDRNKRLKKMLNDQTVLIFPSSGVQQVDGMPNFGIVHADLKNVVKGAQKQKKDQTKKILKPRTDTNLKKKNGDDSDDDKKAKGGASIDPKSFRGNTDLYKHTTDF